uniref:porin n=1 Tax=Cupriavidus yeoncheonensis TaxID=1462994 RepID=UPI003F496519
MKKAALAAAVLGTLSNVAIAQSSVTLYGVADMGLEYVNQVGATPSAANGFNPGTGHSVTRLNSGGLSGSRWGLRGTEDLGSGLSSVFVLESGFNMDTGLSTQGGRLFGRQAFVGIQSKSYGQILLGRQYTSLFDAMANFVPMRFATEYEPAGVLLGPNFREDNTVKYKGVFGPVSASAHWSFGTGLVVPQASPLLGAGGGSGEVPGQFRRDSAYGVGVNYFSGKVGVGVGYDQFNPTYGTDTGTFKNAAVSASYFIADTLKVIGGYRWGQNRGPGGRLIKRDNFYWAGAQYQATPTIGFMFEYDYDDVKSQFGSNTPNLWQISLTSTYSFSKRTDLYATVGYSKNAGLALDSLSNNFASSNAYGMPYSLANGQSSMLGVAIGLRHTF